MSPQRTSNLEPEATSANPVATTSEPGPGWTRRRFLGAAAAGASAFALGSLPKAARPNILLITGDDLGVQLGCYGDAKARTPHIDALAARGTRFERAWVTQASCSPSRSSLFTGLYPHQTGQLGLSHMGYSMHPGIPTLPARLTAAGYRTGVLGKIHVRPRSDLPFEFDRESIAKQTRDVASVAAEARSFLAADDARPFFLLVSYMDPHRPFKPRLTQVKGLPEKVVGAEDVETFPWLGVDGPSLRRDIASYSNYVARLDSGIGMLMEALERSGRAKDTIVVFLGDHGPPFTRSKASCYEAGLQVPLILRWDGVARAGASVPSLVSSVDVATTLFRAVGAPAPEHGDGRDLRPLVTGEVTSLREFVYAEYNSHLPIAWYPRRALRDARYKLIANLLSPTRNPARSIDGCQAFAISRETRYDGTPQRELWDRYIEPPSIELYDLERDPYELVDRAEDPAMKDVRARLEAELRAWRARTGDPLRDPEVLASLTARHASLSGGYRRWSGPIPPPTYGP